MLGFYLTVSKVTLHTIFLSLKSVHFLFSILFYLFSKYLLSACCMQSTMLRAVNDKKNWTFFGIHKYLWVPSLF